MNRKDDTLTRARSYHQTGNLYEAERLYRQVLSKRPNHGETMYNLSMILRGTKRYSEAISFLQRILSIRTDRIEIYNDLCYCLHIEGRIDEAVQIAEKAIKAIPQSPIGYFHLGQLYVSTLKPTEALKVLLEGFQNTGGDPDMEKMLADAYTNLGRFEDAIKHYRNVLKVHPNNSEFHCDLANALRSHGDLAEAVKCYDRSIMLTPNNPRAIAGKVEALESQRNRDQALSLAQDAVARGLVHADLGLAYARVCRRAGQCESAIPYLNRILDPAQTEKLSQQLKSQLLLMLGSLYEDTAKYDEAFNAYYQGNKLYNNVLDEKQALSSIQALKTDFSRDKIADYAHSTNDSELPVFIVGMPRSGTSLVEQILASHPLVYGGGERRDIHEIANNISSLSGSSEPFPNCFNYITAASLDNIARDHLQKLKEIAPPGKTRFTDKNPLNYFHLGLIALLLPKARIIHCKRHPLDICISCFATRLGPSHHYANDLGHLGTAYCIYHEIMQHWHASLDIPIMDVQYEEMVNDQETMTRKLLDFCGLEFDEACLHYYDNQRLTRTASVDQVTRPVYNSSIGRYKHFESHLKPLKEKLSAYL